MSSQLRLLNPLSPPWYCQVLTTVTLFCQECPNSSSENSRRFKIVLPDPFSRPLNALMIHHCWLNCIGFQLVKELNMESLPCAVILSQRLLSLTCRTCFTCTSHPVHCSPLLTPAFFGFQTERKGFKGNALFPIWALSHGISIHTLYAIPVQNSTQNHTIPLSPWTKLLILCVFVASHIPLPPSPPSFPVDLPALICVCCTHACLHACSCVCACARVCVCVCVCVC